jgi:hypothetical protein
VRTASLLAIRDAHHGFFCVVAVEAGWRAHTRF